MKKIIITTILGMAAMVLITACGKTDSAALTTGALNGTVRIDGSSTVFPITEAVAEEFGKIQPGIRVTVGISGTGGGFKKFMIGETDISDASRPVKQSELDKGTNHNIAFIELPIAFDGLSVVVSRENDWVDQLTVAELHEIWKPGSTVQTWQDVRPEWPAEEIKLYGPGTDSGTFDYFTEAINGKSQSCRSDFSKSEDDNVLVQGVAGDKYSLGFFGFAYYTENKDIIRVVPIDNGSGPVSPSIETINNGSYQPLSRPIFIYVNTDAANRDVVDTFVHFYIENAAVLAQEVGYVALPDEAYRLDKDRFDNKTSGSVFAGHITVGLKIEDILSKEK